MTLSKICSEGYIRLTPKIIMPEHEEVKSYILLSFDNFSPNGTNPEFRDCTISFDIICHTDYWELGDYQLRPQKIAGYIDGILNNTKLTGIGIINFNSAKQLLLSEEFSGLMLDYIAVHGSDDYIPEE